MAKFNMANIVTSSVLPIGYYDCTVVSFEETRTQKDALMFVVECRVNKPEQFRGKKLTEYFTVGKRPWTVKDTTPEDEIDFYNLDDPDAEDQRTVDRLMKPLKAFTEAAEWERSKDPEWDTDDLVDEAPGLKVGIRVKHEEYNGRTTHKPGFFYTIGTHEPGVEGTQQTAVPATARPTRTRTRAVVEEED